MTSIFCALLQVFADFELICKAFNFQCTCIYGGSPYGPQENALRRGVDVVVGTPGRVKDMIEKKVLKLEKLVYAPYKSSKETKKSSFSHFAFSHFALGIPGSDAIKIAEEACARSHRLVADTDGDIWSKYLQR